MADTSNRMGLLISAFMVLLLGVVLIRPIADDINQVTTSSYTVTNETLSFVDLTTGIISETVILANTSGLNLTGNLVNDNITAVATLTNSTGGDRINECNVTFRSGGIVCNFTEYPADVILNYTFVSGKTETLDNDDLTVFSAIRNITDEDLIDECNVTLSTGALVCNNTHSNIGFADYSYETNTAFVRSSATRTLLTIVVLFFAIAVLTVGIGFAIKALKDGDLI